jgi:hypothetical protein
MRKPLLTIKRLGLLTHANLKTDELIVFVGVALVTLWLSSFVGVVLADPPSTETTTQTNGTSDTDVAGATSDLPDAPTPSVIEDHENVAPDAPIAENPNDKDAQEDPKTTEEVTTTGSPTASTTETAAPATDAGANGQIPAGTAADATTLQPETKPEANAAQATEAPTDEGTAPPMQDDYQGPDDKPTLYQKAITPSELQDTVVRLINTYEKGNLDGFTALFSQNAQTNDRNNLRDIREDYADLFESTVDRQLFITDLNWDINYNKATVVGKLEALVIYHQDQPIKRYSGKILIEVEKLGKKLFINKLMHILK